VTPGEGVVAMSPCGQVYVPNSWQRTPRLGNLRSEKPGPLSFASFSSEYCSEHGLRAEVSARVLLCRTQKCSGQWNVVLCCKRRATRSLLTQSHHPVSLSSQAHVQVPSRTITSRLVTKLKASRRSRITMHFNKRYGGEVLSTPAEVTHSHMTRP
jgi:hypothetical protein